MHSIIEVPGRLDIQLARGAKYYAEFEAHLRTTHTKVDTVSRPVASTIGFKVHQWVFHPVGRGSFQRSQRMYKLPNFT